MQTAVQHDVVPPRDKKPTDDEPSTQVAIRLQRSMLSDIDEEIARISPKGFSITRSDMIRALLAEALAVRKKAAGRKQ